IEVKCSKCQKRMLAPQAGIVVACPHCGTKLRVPPAAGGAPAANIVAPPAPPIAESPVVSAEPAAERDAGARRSDSAPAGSGGDVPDFSALAAMNLEAPAPWTPPAALPETKAEAQPAAPPPLTDLRETPAPSETPPSTTPEREPGAPPEG